MGQEQSLKPNGGPLGARVLRNCTGCTPLKQPPPHHLTRGAYYYRSQRRLLKARDSEWAQDYSADGGAGMQTLAVLAV